MAPSYFHTAGVTGSIPVSSANKINQLETMTFPKHDRHLSSVRPALRPLCERIRRAAKAHHALPAHINKAVIDESPMVVPANEVLKRYYRVVNPTYKKIIAVSFENQQLTQLRDWLLPMLMNGQVTVSDQSAQAQ